MTIATLTVVFGKRLTTINTFTILLQELRCDIRIDLLRLAPGSRSAGGLGRGTSGPRRKNLEEYYLSWKG